MRFPASLPEFSSWIPLFGKNCQREGEARLGVCGTFRTFRGAFPLSPQSGGWCERPRRANGAGGEKQESPEVIGRFQDTSGSRQSQPHLNNAPSVHSFTADSPSA